MNKDQKAAVVDRVASQIEEADAVFAVDYRGISVKQASDLRTSLREADASFQIVKNTLTELAADRAGAEHLKPFLEGPTALTFVHGDVALAAKALARFRRESGLLQWKGGQMEGQPLTADEIESISRLPAVEVLHGQLVGTIAAPLTGLVRGLASMISGLASQLEQIRAQGLIGAVQPAADSPQPAEASGSDDAPAPEEDPTEAEAPADAGVSEEAGGTGGSGETEAGESADEPPAQEEAPADAAPAEEAAAEATSEAPGDPVAEGEAAEAAEETETETQEDSNA